MSIWYKSKMFSLKDVGMTVPKTIETRVQYGKEEGTTNKVQYEAKAENNVIQ